MENNVITQETIAGWMEILKAYHAGLAKTKARIVASENWWKLRNTAQERQETALGRDGGFRSGCARGDGDEDCRDGDRRAVELLEPEKMARCRQLLVCTCYQDHGEPTPARRTAENRPRHRRLGVVRVLRLSPTDGCGDGGLGKVGCAERPTSPAARAARAHLACLPPMQFVPSRESRVPGECRAVRQHAD